MNETKVAVYRMNPAEDRIVFGDEITEGMWVLNEVPYHRTPYGEDEDAQLLAQRFRRVTRVRYTRKFGTTQIVFVGEWVDGYQQVHTFTVDAAWLVKNPREEG